MEIMTFSGPTLLKFNHNKVRLAFCNPMGDPPTQNPHQIKPGYSIIEASLIDILSFRKTSSSMRIYTDKLPLIGTSQLEVSRDKQGLGDQARMYNPTQLPLQQSLYQKDRGFYNHIYPGTMERAIQEAMNTPHPYHSRGYQQQLHQAG